MIIMLEKYLLLLVLACMSINGVPMPEPDPNVAVNINININGNEDKNLGNVGTACNYNGATNDSTSRIGGQTRMPRHTIRGDACVRAFGVPAECGYHDLDYRWCYIANNGVVQRNSWYYCSSNGDACPSPCFVYTHVCKDCSDHSQALEFVKGHRTNLYTSKGERLKLSHVFSEVDNNIISYEEDPYKGDNGWEDACYATKYVPTWLCEVKWVGDEGEWDNCNNFKGFCVSISARSNGHLWPESVNCKK